ncbi:hypothetical protein [Bosea sp. ASV33]|uniref:hypothetical protein n=1 Tax=Bosea sp. ASV33 TaxID=2795106 RepID=UPI0018ED13C0|nr:hypothetical protein [Bosea sp. ASV33]
MHKNSIIYAAAIAMALSTSTAMADKVDLSPAQRAANIKEYNKRKAQGIVDTPLGGRGASKKALHEHVGGTAQRQASGQSRQKCEEAAQNAQATATGTAVLSSVIGLIPFGGSASGFAVAAANVGASAAGEIARQNSTAAMQKECM